MRSQRRGEPFLVGASAAMLLVAALAQLATSAPRPRTVEATGGTTPHAVHSPSPRDAVTLDAVEGDDPRHEERGGDGSHGGGHGLPTITTIPAITIPPITIPPTTIPPVPKSVPIPIPPGDPGDCPVGAPTPVTDRNALEPGMYIATADGSGVVRLLTGLIGNPAWTPDGLALTFTNEFTRTATESSELCVSSLTGVPLRQLWKGHVARFGPGEQRAQWSQDQRQVLFLIQDPFDDYRFNLMIREAADGAARRLVVDRDLNVYTWLPGDKRIAFSTAKTLESIARDGSARLPIDLLHAAGPFGQLHLSPQGDRMAFVQNYYDLDVENIDGTGFRRLWSSPSGEIAHFTWAPDGTRLAVNGNDNGAMGLFVVNDDGSDLHRIAAGYCFYVNASPDGSKLLYAESSNTNAGDKLRVTRWDGTDNRIVASALPGNTINMGNGWSPDGTRVVFSVYPVS